MVCNLCLKIHKMLLRLSENCLMCDVCYQKLLRLSENFLMCNECYIKSCYVSVRTLCVIIVLYLSYCVYYLRTV